MVYAKYVEYCFPQNGASGLRTAPARRRGAAPPCGAAWRIIALRGAGAMMFPLPGTVKERR